MARVADKFHTTPVAITIHYCTRCGAQIGRGDSYDRRATPPWLLNDFFWIVEKICYDCLGQTRMTHVDPYRY